MAKVQESKFVDGRLNGYAVYCPACKHAHIFNAPGARADGTAWTFNGDMERPTFTPSMLSRTPKWDKAAGKFSTSEYSSICHSFVTDGRIQFLSDCTHNLAGQTIDLPDFPQEHRT